MRKLLMGSMIVAGLLPFSAARGQSAQRSATSAPDAAHDIAGVWIMDVDAYHAHPNYGSLKPAPMTPWAAERFKANAGKAGYDDPTYRCNPPGLPRVALGQAPFEIIEIPGRILIFYEDFYTRRTIWMDGRPIPKDPDPSWYGYSVGHWEGDTLVVDSVGFNDRSWMDGAAHPHSEAMHIIERYQRVDHDTLSLTMTITDPKAYTAPWVSISPKTFKLGPKTGPSSEVIELACVPEDEESFRQAVRVPANAKTSDNGGEK